MATQLLRNAFLLLCVTAVFNVYSQNDENTAKAEIVPADINVIIAPEGFQTTDKINGYIHQTTGTSIIISEIKNVNYINMGKSKTDEYFARNQLTLVEKRELHSDSGAKGLVYKTTLTSKGIDYTRYFIYTGDTNSTIWILITHPTEYEALIEDQILKCIQSVNLENLNRNEN